MINTNNVDLKNIPNIKKTNRYQLIKPIVSHKIYETHSFNRASKKCYNELIALKMLNVNSFTIRDIDTNTMFTFKIHEDKNTQLNQLQSAQQIVNSARQLNSNLRINPTIPDRIDRSDINNLIHINSHSAKYFGQMDDKIINFKQIGGNDSDSDQPIQLPISTMPDRTAHVGLVDKTGSVDKMELFESKIVNHNLRLNMIEEKLLNVNKEIDGLKCKKEDQCVIS